MVEKEVLRAFRALFNGFEEQWHNAMQQESVDSESEAEEPQCDPVIHAVGTQSPLLRIRRIGLRIKNRNSICAMIGFNQLLWHGSPEV